jgi:PadR family transcriptional regulator PadR
MGQSTLYPLLYNLEAKGLIEGVWREASAADGGRKRKYYRLTGAGKKRLAADTKQWLALSDAMGALGLSPREVRA